MRHSIQKYLFSQSIICLLLISVSQVANFSKQIIFGLVKLDSAAKDVVIFNDEQTKYLPNHNRQSWSKPANVEPCHLNTSLMR